MDTKWKEEHLNFSTHKTIDQIISLLEQFQKREKKVVIEPVQPTVDAFGRASKEFDISVVLSGKTSVFKNPWAVQVYVDDIGEQREVELVALGISKAAQYAGAFAGVYGSRDGVSLAAAPELKESVSFMHKIADSIK